MGGGGCPRPLLVDDVIQKAGPALPSPFSGSRTLALPLLLVSEGHERKTRSKYLYKKIKSREAPGIPRERCCR